MNGMHVSESKSAEDLLSECARQAEWLREQICRIRREQIDRILKLLNECRSVDKSLTMQTTELKLQIEKIQRQIDDMHYCRQETDEQGADTVESMAAYPRLQPEKARPLSTVLGKLLNCTEGENGNSLRAVTHEGPLGQECSQERSPEDLDPKVRAMKRSGPLDGEEARRVAELAKRLAYYADRNVIRPLAWQHEQTS